MLRKRVKKYIQLIRFFAGSILYKNGKEFYKTAVDLSFTHAAAGRYSLALLILKRSVLIRRNSKIDSEIKVLKKNRNSNFNHYSNIKAAREILKKDSLSPEKAFSYMLSYEKTNKNTPLKLARIFNDHLLKESSLYAINDNAKKEMKVNNESVLVTYVACVTSAKEDKVDEALHYIDSAIEAADKKLTSNIISSLDYNAYLNKIIDIWHVVNNISRQHTKDVKEPKIYQEETSLRQVFNQEHRGFGVSFYLNRAAVLKEVKRTQEYLEVCENIFYKSESNHDKLAVINAIVKAGKRKEKDYNDTYDKAVGLFRSVRSHFIELGVGLENKQVIEENEAKEIISAYKISLKLGLIDDSGFFKRVLFSILDNKQKKISSWVIAETLPFEEIENKFIIKSNNFYELFQEPKTNAERKAYFSIAARAGWFEEASSVFDRLTKKEQSHISSLPFVSVCERKGDFERACQLTFSICSLMTKKIHKLSYERHWLLCFQSMKSLQFHVETSKIYGRVKQPRNPKGIVFVSAHNINELRALPLMVLIQAKKSGWAVIPLVEGILPKELTGNEKIDKYNGCISKEGNLRPLELLDVSKDVSQQFKSNCGELIYKDIDFSHAAWEGVTLYQRKYNIDFNCQQVKNFLGFKEKVTISYLSVLEAIINKDKKFLLKNAFITTNPHRLPYAAIRKFCENYGDADNFYCIQASNAYENYFSNFKTNISTRYALDNVTRYPKIRVPFLPTPEVFLNWYALNKNHAKDMLNEVVSLTDMRRSTLGEKKSDGAIEALHKVRKWRESGGKVACLFGKVVCDLAVPYDGGPAHSSMKDWLNHTIESVRNSNTLLLIKPHPHELKHEIGIFLNETFEDLIEADLHDNVIVLGHRWLDIAELKDIVDVGLLYNGTTAVELGVMGVPSILCSYFGPSDYPVGHAVPNGREHYKRLVRFEEEIVVSDELQMKSAAWLKFLSSDDVSVPYRYHSRPLTNKHLSSLQWFEEDLENYFADGDQYVQLLANKITQ
ncbi:MAG: hypothetical protein ACQEUY_16610 [Pseudomonadota bacterium]